MTDKIYQCKDIKERYFVNIETGALIRELFIEDKKARVDESNDLIGVDFDFENLKELSYEEYYFYLKICNWYYNLPG